MPRNLLRLALCAVLVAGVMRGSGRPVYSGLTAHEWGTFTSIAGQDGSAMEWSPLNGSTDLPGFVEHFKNAAFKRGLRGTVRMETPVLYLYDSREETVSVKVSFEKGVITEWYPGASRVTPTAALYDGSLYQQNLGGSIAWDSVTVSPSLRTNFPREANENPYYAARMTSATPLRVKTPAGEQQEKFLFYRGVSTFTVPLAARLTGGARVELASRSGETIPGVIYFERRGEKTGFRVGGSVEQSAAIEAPELNGTVEELGREMEGMLVAQGLYQDEARAMVATWRSSWFEEGSRLLYIVPRSLVDSVLPLTISPAPSQTVRVFVGRIELVTPATEQEVETAVNKGDRATLQLFARFLEPILGGITRKETNPEKTKRLNAALNSYINAQITQNLR